jgi:hypothetical protein
MYTRNSITKPAKIAQGINSRRGIATGAGIARGRAGLAIMVVCSFGIVRPLRSLGCSQV